jgi:hypothetical protein
LHDALDSVGVPTTFHVTAHQLSESRIDHDDDVIDGRSIERQQPIEHWFAGDPHEHFREAGTEA